MKRLLHRLFPSVRRRENREAWVVHHEHMQRLHEELAREHETKATLLLEAHNIGAHTPAELRQ